MIDVYSETWRIIEQSVTDMRERAVNDLIEGAGNENVLRGIIAACTTIMQLKNRPDIPGISKAQTYI